MTDDPRQAAGDATGGLVVLGHAITHGPALPLGVDDPVAAARAVRRALADARRRAIDVAVLAVVASEPIPDDVLGRFARRALGPHGAFVATAAHVSAAGDAETLAKHAMATVEAVGATGDVGVAVAVGLGDDGDVVALCLGDTPGGSLP